MGHVFRAKAPYTHPGGFDVILRNLVRVADVWMDDFKQIFYRKNSMAMDIGAGNITDRINLRKNLQCKSFQWYLDNVYPEKDYLLDRDINFRKFWGSSRLYIQSRLYCDSSYAPCDQDLKLVTKALFSNNKSFRGSDRYIKKSRRTNDVY